MYELKIKDRQGVWHSADLLSDEVPTMNYQVNSLAELKDRQASYSQALKLPKTAKNVSIIERADVFEVDTDLPYTALECRLFSNGYVLAGKGSIIIIDKITDYIEAQILAGNADFFELLGDTDLSTIDLGSTIVDSSTYPAIVRRANCVVGYYNELPQNRYTYFLNLFGTINQMLANLGYTIVHNLPSLTTSNDYFNLCSRKPKEDSLMVFSSSLGYTGTFTGSAGNAGGQIYAPLQVVTSGLGTLTIGAGHIHGIYDIIFTSNINGKIKISTLLAGTVNINSPIGHFNFIFTAVKSGNEEVSYRPDASTLDLFFSNEVEIEVTKGETINFQAYAQVSSPASQSINIALDITTSITYISADEVPTGGKLYFGNNTGFDTCLDLFKTFVQTYGLTVDIDNVNKVVKAYTMQKLYDNKAIAVDWSKKLHMGNRDLSFILDSYARTNSIKFSSKDDIEDKGTFNVANSNLDKTKDLFSLKWESGEDVVINGLSLASIPLFTYKSVNDTDRDIQESKPHLVRVTRFGNPIFIANHIKAQSLIDNYYTDLTTKMLVNAKRLEALFYLTEIDIEAFDPFTPVYISYYGAYFYVEKISNFVDGKLTKVNLIKL